MKKNQPAGGDTPQDFIDQQPFQVTPSPALLKTNVDIARHNLQVRLKQVKEGCFRAAKKTVEEGDHEKIQKMDAFVRKVYTDEPDKMAEWEALMWKYESARDQDAS